MRSHKVLSGFKVLGAEKAAKHFRKVFQHLVEGLKKSIEVHWDHEFQKGPECFLDTAERTLLHVVTENS